VHITFSPVDEASLERANALSSELYRHEGLPAQDAGRERALAELAAHAESGGAWLILADSAVAGYVVLTACYSLEFHGRFGLLDELYIEERWRGRGIGNAALAFVDEQCRSRGWKAVRLEVRHTNLRARELYRRAGYRAEERHLMTKWL
jgi:ribosomal protein S18 acetylase RimI-like enzyme